MKILSLVQNSPAWYAHRASHWNASDAPAMLGVSPYKSRNQLIRERATGVEPELDIATQRRFADGHRFEALARPIAEQIIGEELYPCVGVEGRYSASFDGLTLLGDTAFEHKTLNDDLRAIINLAGVLDADLLPEHYRVQMEQQCLVSGAERVLFMASTWKGDELDEERHCWYLPDRDLRARIVAGWRQFEADVATYVPESAAAPQPVGRTPETLPSLRIEARGMVTASNLTEFHDHAMAVLSGINRELATDDDFADAESTVKWCRTVEDRLDAAKANVLAQMADVDTVCRTIDDIAAETRRVRLELDKLVKTERERRKSDIVTIGVDAVRAHYATVNATLGEHAILAPQSLSLNIGGAIKGLRTLTSITDAVDTAVAIAKIEANQRADAVRASFAVLAETMVGHETLFPDRVALCASKAPDDIRNLAAARIAEHEKRELARMESERERMRAEEAARVRAEAEREATAFTQRPNAKIGPIPTPSGARIKLGDINARLAPLSISADGLAQLGFTAVGNDRAAKLYAEADWPRICDAVIALVSRAATARRAA